jgi:hypothetical protein
MGNMEIEAERAICARGAALDHRAAITHVP